MHVVPAARRCAQHQPVAQHSRSSFMKQVAAVAAALALAACDQALPTEPEPARVTRPQLATAGSTWEITGKGTAELTGGQGGNQVETRATYKCVVGGPFPYFVVQVTVLQDGIAAGAWGEAETCVKP